MTHTARITMAAVVALALAAGTSPAADDPLREDTGRSPHDRSAVSPTAGQQSNDPADLKLTQEIRKAVPNWLVWTHGCPGGETTAAVCERADRAIDMALRHMESRDVVFVGHGHFSRAVITRWVELPVYEGIRFSMTAASVAVCGFEHGARQLSALGLTGSPHPSGST